MFFFYCIYFSVDSSFWGPDIVSAEPEITVHEAGEFSVGLGSLSFWLEHKFRVN